MQAYIREHEIVSRIWHLFEDFRRQVYPSKLPYLRSIYITGKGRRMEGSRMFTVTIPSPNPVSHAA
eukprot:833793-Amorphochlora_amoeboformis.AAC.3